jgi:hypothetical protein
MGIHGRPPTQAVLLADEIWRILSQPGAFADAEVKILQSQIFMQKQHIMKDLDCPRSVKYIATCSERELLRSNNFPSCPNLPPPNYLAMAGIDPVEHVPPSSLPLVASHTAQRTNWLFNRTRLNGDSSRKT